MPKPTGTADYSRSRLADYSEGVRAERGSMDLPFLLLTLLLLGIGVVMVLSASFARAYYDTTGETGGNPSYYFTRQIMFAMGGVGTAYLFSRLPVEFFRKHSMFLLLVALVLLAVVPFVGVTVNNATRWINLGFTTFQPSEIAKLAVVLAFSTMICKYKDKMSKAKTMLPFLAILGVITALLLLEPHMSAIIIIILLGAVMLFIGGVKLYWFIGGVGALGLLGGLAMILPTLSHVRERIDVWLHPLEDKTGDAWQVIQSLYAVGSGGLMGLGLGQSRQKYLYLPEEHNDFIFSVISEELGFIGAALILALFAMLIVRGYYIAMHARSRYGFLVCAGLTTLFAIQVILNVAVVTNLLPATGISLPFFSYGGTALLIQMAEIGVILSISRDIPAKKEL